MHTPAGLPRRRQGLTQHKGFAHRALDENGLAGPQKYGDIGG